MLYSVRYLAFHQNEHHEQFVGAGTGTLVKAGIGLFTAYNIVLKHRGNVEVMSEVGIGTTFTVIIPEQANSAGRTTSA